MNPLFPPKPRSDHFRYSEVPVFILAGGLGSRISEESSIKPKPMIELGGIPVLIHIMRSYYQYGFNDFVICAGYKAFEIKKYFMHYEVELNDLEMDHRDSLVSPCRSINHNHAQEYWRVRVLDTGMGSQTGARLNHALRVIQKDTFFDHFAVTYGDGLCDVNLDQEFQYHLKHNATGTVLGVKNNARYGELDIRDEDVATSFVEKAEDRQGFVNGGFFFFRKDFAGYLAQGDEGLALEHDPLRQLAKHGELRVFKHLGFWHAMDTLRDKTFLQQLWEGGKAPWLPKTRPSARTREPLTAETLLSEKGRLTT